jgi:cytochrome c peroxidase
VTTRIKPRKAKPTLRAAPDDENADPNHGLHSTPLERTESRDNDGRLGADNPLAMGGGDVKSSALDVSAAPNMSSNAEDMHDGEIYNLRASDEEEETIAPIAKLKS